MYFSYKNLEEIVFEDNFFDAIFSYKVMHYTNQSEVLNEFFTILKPGGKLNVMVDLWRWYFDYPHDSILERIRYLMHISPFGNRCFNTKKSIANLVIATGFKIASEGQEGHTFFDDYPKFDSENCFYETVEIGREKLWEICA